MNKNNVQIILAAVLTIAIAIIIIVIAMTMKSTEKNSVEKINITASFYPLAHFAEQVGGANVAVYTIVPSGVEPHDFEPTPQDIARVQKADLFVYNGAGVDAWAEEAASNTRAGARVINMSTVVPLRDADPHFWLDPTIATIEVEAIRQALAAVDPTHANQYNERARIYTAELAAVDQDYRTGLTQCATNKIIVSHDAFGYPAARYGIEQITIAGISPEEEPTPQQLAEIVTAARENNIITIFFETLVSPKLSQTIAAEIGGTVAVLNPLEGLTQEEIASGNNYISIMQENLAQLRAAMQCQ